MISKCTYIHTYHLYSALYEHAYCRQVLRGLLSQLLIDHLLILPLVTVLPTLQVLPFSCLTRPPLCGRVQNALD